MGTSVIMNYSEMESAILVNCMGDRSLKFEDKFEIRNVLQRRMQGSALHKLEEYYTKNQGKIAEEVLYLVKFEIETKRAKNIQYRRKRGLEAKGGAFLPKGEDSIFKTISYLKAQGDYKRGSRLEPYFSNDYPFEREELNSKIMVNKLFKGGTDVFKKYNGYAKAMDFIKKHIKEEEEGINNLGEIYLYFNYANVAQFDAELRDYKPMAIPLLQWDYEKGYTNIYDQYRIDQVIPLKVKTL